MAQLMDSPAFMTQMTRMLSDPGVLDQVNAAPVLPVCVLT